MFQLVGLLLLVTSALVSTYAGSISTLQLTDPILASIYSPPVRDVVAGEQLLIETTAYRPSNPYYNDTEPLQFIAIIDTRDGEGTTLSIAFQSGTLMANKQAAIGTSWTPPEPGKYYLGAFAISDLGPNGIILSSGAQSTITVM